MSREGVDFTNVWPICWTPEEEERITSRFLSAYLSGVDIDELEDRFRRGLKRLYGSLSREQRAERKRVMHENRMSNTGKAPDMPRPSNFNPWWRSKPWPKKREREFAPMTNGMLGWG